MTLLKSKAQLRLAQLYYQGRLSEKDDVEALKLALIVAEKNILILVEEKKII
jgi:TPR repeat protein